MKRKTKRRAARVVRAWRWFGVFDGNELVAVYSFRSLAEIYATAALYLVRPVLISRRRP